MGGNPTLNTPDNLVALCSRCHSCVDHRNVPKTQWLRIVKFDPEDKEDGFWVEKFMPHDDKYVRIPNNALSFYG